MLEFNGKKPIKKNLTVEPIALSDKQNQQLEKIMKSKKGSIYKRWELRKVMFSNTGNNTGSAGGSCCSCGQLPTHVLKYHVKHVFLVQKYCESCLRKEGLI